MNSIPLPSSGDTRAFSHVTTWVFDLDNTLYPPSARLFDLIDAGQLHEARDLWAKMWPVNQFLVTEGYAASVKAGANLIGFHVGNPRPPYRPLAPEKVEELRGLLVEVGAIGR